MRHQNLLGVPSADQPGPAPTLLPDDIESQVRDALEAGQEALDIARDFPSSQLVWATLSQEAAQEGRTVDSYAYARVGYHRGLDLLRKSGWRGHGPIPWSHEANRGFLTALFLLGQAASDIGEVEEAVRVQDFLEGSDPEVIGILKGQQ